MKPNMSKVLQICSLIVLISCLGIAKRGQAGERINVIAWPVACSEEIKALLPEFEKETGIKVRMELAPEPVLHDKLAIEYAAATGAYDVAMLGFAQYPEMASAGFIENLDPYIKQKADPRWLDMSDFFEGYSNSLKVDGKYYGLPLYLWGGCLMYRKDLLDKYGVKPPKTMEELAEAARKLTLDTDGDGKIDVYGISMRGTKGPFSTLSLGFIYSFGGEFLDESYRPAFTSPEAVKAVKLYVDLLRNYGPPGQANYNWMEVQEIMVTGKCAMILEASDFAGRMEDPKTSQVAGKLGYTLLPREKRPSGYMFCAGWAMASASKHKDAAWKFMQWSTSKAVGMKTIASGRRTDFCNRSVWESKEYQAKHPYVTTLMASMDEAHPNYFPRIPEYTEVILNFTGHVSEAIAGSVSTEEALNQASKDISKILKEKIAQHK